MGPVVAVTDEIRTWIPPKATDIAWRNLTAVVKWLIIVDGKGMSARRLAVIRRLRELADKIEAGKLGVDD